MLTDMLRKYSWMYNETIEEGRAEGRVEGRVEGRAQGRVEEAHKLIEALVQVRFPALLASVKARIKLMTDLEKLQGFLLTVSLAQTQEEVAKALAALH